MRISPRAEHTLRGRPYVQYTVPAPAIYGWVSHDDDG
jgi:hypothetical protein